MNMRAAIAILLMLGAPPVATAQTPGAPGQKPATQTPKPAPPMNPMATKPTAATPSSRPVAPGSGPVTLLCRNLGDVANNPPGHDESTIAYSRVSVRDADGAIVHFYAPTLVRISKGFAPAPGLSGTRGELLPRGSCGMTNAVIATRATESRLMRLMITDAQSYSTTTTQSRQSTLVGDTAAGHFVSLVQPVCPSGVQRVQATRLSEFEFFVSLGVPNNMTCVE